MSCRGTARHHDMTTLSRHVVALPTAALILAAMTSMLVDGRSIVALKSQGLGNITNPTFMEANLAILLGETYSIGLHHDASGRAWSHTDVSVGTLKQVIAALGPKATVGALTAFHNGKDLISLNALKHPSTSLSCYGLRDAGLSAMSLGYFEGVAAGFLILLHAAVLVGRLQISTRLAAFVWLVLSIGFFAITILIVLIYSLTWECDQPLLPLLRLKDSFDLTYGLPFSIVSFTASLACAIMFACSSTPQAQVVAGEIKSDDATNGELKSVNQVTTVKYVSETPLTQDELPYQRPNVAPSVVLVKANIARVAGAITVYSVPAPPNTMHGDRISCQLPDSSTVVITVPCNVGPVANRPLEFALPTERWKPCAIVRTRDEHVYNHVCPSQSRLASHEARVAHAWLQGAEDRLLAADFLEV